MAAHAVHPTEGVSRTTSGPAKALRFRDRGGNDRRALRRPASLAVTKDPDVSDEEPEEIIQTLPLDRWHRARDARMVPFAGYQMPIQYEGIIAEHLWTRESAGLFDVSHMGQLLVSGGAADVALEALLPGDMVNLGVDRMRYSLLLDDEGGILDDLMVTRLPGAGLFGAAAFYLVVNGATKADDIAHLLPRHDLRAPPTPRPRAPPRERLFSCVSDSGVRRTQRRPGPQGLRRLHGRRAEERDRH